MIDLHCHLHYGVDDGPKERHHTVEFAKALVGAGVTQVACTSHLRREKGWVNDCCVQPHMHGRLREALDSAGIVLPVVEGAEHYLDELLVETAQKKEVVPYSNTQWLLVELPYSGLPPNLMTTLYSLRKLGYRLLMAHMERFPYVYDNEDLLQSMISAGYAFQVNLGSLSGVYGREYKKPAERLVSEGYITVAGGDCHSAEDVVQCIVAGRKALIKQVGEVAARTLCEQNPAKILENCTPEALEQI